MTRKTADILVRDFGEYVSKVASMHRAYILEMVPETPGQGPVLALRGANEGFKCIGRIIYYILENCELARGIAVNNV